MADWKGEKVGKVSSDDLDIALGCYSFFGCTAYSDTRFSREPACGGRMAAFLTLQITTTDQQASNRKSRDSLHVSAANQDDMF